MKVLFVHGSNAVKEDKEGNLYMDGSYSEEVWERYYKLTNDLTVMTKKEKEVYDVQVARNKFHKFNNEKYKFIEIINDSVLEEEVKKTDIVIIRVPSRTSYKAIDYAKKYNKKYLLEVVGCTFDLYWNTGGVKNKVTAIKTYLQFKKYVKEAEYVVYVSNVFLQKRYSTSGKSVACCDAVLKDFNDEILAERIRKIESKKDDEAIVLCTVGSTDFKIKGQDHVIKAISKLNKNGYNYKYIIVGGNDITRLKSIAEKYGVDDVVEFTGMQPHSKVFEYMKNCDIYIQPSETEGLPRVMVEAISVAAPCIGSDVGGIPELIDEKFVFKSKNVRSLMNTLKQMNKDEMVKQATKNYEKSKEFDEKVLNKRREEFYNLLVEEK